MFDVLLNRLRPPVAQQPRNRYGLIEKKSGFGYLGGSSDVGQWICIRGSRQVEGIRSGEIGWWLELQGMAVHKHKLKIQVHAEIQRHSPSSKSSTTDELLRTDDLDDLPITDDL
jgi:hypothetical protein